MQRDWLSDKQWQNAQKLSANLNLFGINSFMTQGDTQDDERIVLTNLLRKQIFLNSKVHCSHNFFWPPSLMVKGQLSTGANPSSGDFWRRSVLQQSCRQVHEFWETKFFFRRMLRKPLSQPRPKFRTRLTEWPKLWSPQGNNWKSELFFLVFTITFFKTSRRLKVKPKSCV